MTFGELNNGDIFFLMQRVDGPMFKKLNETTAIAFLYAASNGMQEDVTVVKIDKKNLREWIEE